jgi:hypothetical protein
MQQTTDPHAPPHADPLDEVRRRLIQIHMALASATDDDREIRRATMHRVMTLLNDIAPPDQQVG